MTNPAHATGQRSRWVVAGMAILLSAGCGTNAPTVTPGPSTATPGPGSTDALTHDLSAVVEIVGYRNGAPAYSGSGTIISRDGLIVTNAHVGMPNADGLAVQYNDPLIDDPVEKLEVRFTTSTDQPPEARYLASLVAVDGYLDAAVLRIASDLDGVPVASTSLDLPFVAVGDSDKLEVFNPLHVIGFPGIGGDTVSTASGEVSGFVEDSKIGARGWIKTSALIYHGNSGGLAANAAGQLIGIPTRLPDFAATSLPGGYNLVRPINLVRPLIESAMAGQTPTKSHYITHGTGDEKLTQVGWTTAEDPGCGLKSPLTGYPSGTKAISPVFKWSDMTKGEDIILLLVGGHAGQDRKPQLVYRLSGEWTDTPNSSNACQVPNFPNSDGWPDDTYTVIAEVDSQRRETSLMEVAVGGQPAPVDGVYLQGRVVSSATGAGLSGAAIYVLNEGVDAFAWIDNKADGDVAASATADGSGSYLMANAVTMGKTYPFVILADGYQPWVGTIQINGPNVEDIGLNPQ